MLAENHVMQVVLYKNIVSPYTHGYALAQVCDWDEFSEYLLETRVNTSADFNMYPIRILSQKMWLQNTNSGAVIKSDRQLIQL